MFGKIDKKERRIKEIFGKYVSTDGLDKIFNEKLEPDPIVEREIGYAIILFEQDEKIYENIKAGIDFFVQKNCIIETIESIYVKICIGAIPIQSQPENPERIFEVIEEYRNRKLPFRSIVFGKEKCKIGNIGSEGRMNFCVMIPQYREKLVELMVMKNGEIKRLTTAST